MHCIGQSPPEAHLLIRTIELDNVTTFECTLVMHNMVAETRPSDRAPQRRQTLCNSPDASACVVNVAVQKGLYNRNQQPTREQAEHCVEDEHFWM
jgi:hypothetical protein